MSITYKCPCGETVYLEDTESTFEFQCHACHKKFYHGFDGEKYYIDFIEEDKC